MQPKTLSLSLLFWGLTWGLISPTLQASSAFEFVKEKGTIACGVHTSLPGFAVESEKGWQGLEADVCRAVAAATLGQADRVQFKPLAGTGYTALQSGDIDVLIRHNRWSIAQDTALGLTFTAPLFYEAQGVLVHSNANFYLLSDLENASICVPDQGRYQEQLILSLNHRASSDASKQLMLFPSTEAAARAFEQNKCQALTGSVSELHKISAALPTGTTNLLPDRMEPYATGPLVRHRDSEWFKIVRWTLNLLINAEQAGISSANIDNLEQQGDARTKRFLAQTGVQGVALGLSPDWSYQVIRQVGNYAEIFNRNLGDASPYRVPRGLNALVSAGGLHIPPALN